MFRVIDEANFLKCTFQNDLKENSDEFEVNELKSGLGGKGVVLHLKSKDGFQIHKSLGEMVMSGNWRIGERTRDNKTELINFLDKKCKKISTFFNALKGEDLYCNPLFNIDKYKQISDQNLWLKMQALRDFSDDIKLTDVKKHLNNRLKEDTQTWALLKEDKKQEVLLKPEIVDTYMHKNDFLNALYDARQHSQDSFNDNTLTEPTPFTPYMAHAFERYWSNHVSKILKKCDHLSISCNIVQEESNSVIAQLCSGEDHRVAKLMLCFKAPDFPRQEEKGYMVNIRITAQNVHSKISIMEQLVAAYKEKNLKNRLNEVCTALSEYFKCNGMIVQPFGELNFRNKKELEDWLNSIKDSLTEKDIQLLGKWVSRGGMNCFSESDIISAKELLAKYFFTDMPAVTTEKSAVENKQKRVTARFQSNVKLDKKIEIGEKIVSKPVLKKKSVKSIIIWVAIVICLIFGIIFLPYLKKDTTNQSSETGKKVSIGKKDTTEINNDEISDTEIIKPIEDADFIYDNSINEQEVIKENQLLESEIKNKQEAMLQLQKLVNYLDNKYERIMETEEPSELDIHKIRSRVLEIRRKFVLNLEPNYLRDDPEIKRMHRRIKKSYRNLKDLDRQIKKSPFFIAIISGESTGEKPLIIKKHQEYEAYYKKIMIKITSDYLSMDFNFNSRDFVTLEFKILNTGSIENVSIIESSQNVNLDNKIENFIKNVRLKKFPDFIKEEYIITRFKFPVG